MNVKYEPDDLVQLFFKELHDAQTILVSLQETGPYKVLIRQGIDQFKKNVDLNEAVDDLKKSHVRKHGRTLKKNHELNNKEPKIQPHSKRDRYLQ